MKKILILVALLVALPSMADSAKLTQDVQAVKNAVLELNKDLYQLERELLSPTSTQYALYFSLREIDNFIPLSIEVQTENLPAVHHIYTEREVEALLQGAVQPLTSTNIGPGLHQINITVRGKNTRGQEQTVKLAGSVEKLTEPLLLEVSVVQASKDYQVQLNTWR